MFYKLIALPFLIISLLGISALKTDNSIMSIHSFKVSDINGDEFDFALLKGKKILVVNVASECGLTPQYALLQELYEEYKDQDFEIVAFPANDFGAQEPGTDEEISTFCTRNYGVEFPVMSKISVKGEDIHPLYKWLTQKELNGLGDFEMVWNFQKFMIDEEGKLLGDVHPQTLPSDEKIINWITGS